MCEMGLENWITTHDNGKKLLTFGIHKIKRFRANCTELMTMKN